VDGDGGGSAVGVGKGLIIEIIDEKCTGYFLRSNGI
jgi:hypothetical protein